MDHQIIAIDGVSVRADGFAARLGQYTPGDRITVTVARRDRLIYLDVALGPEPGGSWRLAPLPAATTGQTARLNTLINGK